MSKSLVLSGDLESRRYAYQSVPVKTYAGTRETFTLSGWAKALSIPLVERDGAETATFRLKARFVYEDDTVEDHIANFSPCTEQWQLASVSFAKEQFKDVRSLDVSCEYDYNTGNAYFDNIQLVRTSLETGLSSSSFIDEADGYSSFEDGVDLSEDIPVFQEATDDYGNTLTSTQSADGQIGTIYRSFAYNDDDPNTEADESGNNLVRETDARGFETKYTVDPESSRRTGVCDRLGNKTAYEYDDSGRVSAIVNKSPDGTQLARVEYEYSEFGELSNIVRNDTMGYSMGYNAFHKLESIGVSGKETPLTSYVYKKGTGRLKKIVWANGSTAAITYNRQGRVMKEDWSDSEGNIVASYGYAYDGNGNVVASVDYKKKMVYNYSYREGVLVRCTESTADTVNADGSVIGKNIVNTISFFYDKEGRLVRKTVTPANGQSIVVAYENSDNNGTSVTFRYGENSVKSHSKTDGFGRKVFDELLLDGGYLNRSFEYCSGKITGEHKAGGKVVSNPVTNLVEKISYSNGDSLSYRYDAAEKITRVEDKEGRICEYEYDALSQLVSETVGDVKTRYVYDSCGNILEKGVCKSDGEIDDSKKTVFTYGDPVWKDLLTGVNGQTITYDAGGNPISYLGHTLQWEKGRQLAKFDNNTYVYNANGIRKSKTVGGIRHDFTLEGAKILSESWSGGKIVPVYDNEDQVCGIICNGTAYYFIKNLQGDVVSITDDKGTVVAGYTYDAWGVPKVDFDCTDTGIATVNPYRYRSYYYDSEIGMYYLQSRYYDPRICRFINADDAKYAAAQGHNLFQYCKNDVVNHRDGFGYAASRCGNRRVFPIDLKKIGKNNWVAKFIGLFVSKLGLISNYPILNINVLGFKLSLAAFAGFSSSAGSFFTLSSDSVSCRIGNISFSTKAKFTVTSPTLNVGYSQVSAFAALAPFELAYGFSVKTSAVIDGVKVYFGLKLAFSVNYFTLLTVAALIVAACIYVPALSPIAAQIGVVASELWANAAAAIAGVTSFLSQALWDIAYA